MNTRAMTHATEQQMTFDDVHDVEKRMEEDYFELSKPDGEKYLVGEWNHTILPELRDRAISTALTRPEYWQLLQREWRITLELFDALHTNRHFATENERPKCYWQRQRFDVFRTHDFARGIAIDKNALSQAAALYLGHPDCRTNRFDWILLDATVFAELEAFAHHVLSTKSGTGFNWAHIFAGRSEAKYYGYTLLFWILGFALNIASGPVLSYFLYKTDHSTSAVVVASIWLLWTLFRIATYPIRWKARRKKAALLNHLTGLHAMAGETTLSPRKLKETLDKAATAGVVLDGSVFAIVDRLVERDPTAFIPSQRT